MRVHKGREVKPVSRNAEQDDEDANDKDKDDEAAAGHGHQQAVHLYLPLASNLITLCRIFHGFTPELSYPMSREAVQWGSTHRRLGL